MCPDPFDTSKEVPCRDGSKTLKCVGETNERPLHKVTLTKPFWIMTTEITQRQYYEVMGENPSEFRIYKRGYRSENNPVEQVTWYEAVSFANKLSDKEGLTRCYGGSGDSIRWDKSCNGYRLPTEAEWEYAARAGTTTEYAGSDPSDTDEVAWNRDNAGNQTHPVGQKKANAWGLYDMSGNVFEWVWDWYGSYMSEVKDPTGPSSGSKRVLRGGSWIKDAWFGRVAFRITDTPGDTNSNVGFRLVRTAK